jgi:hypothetical protein
MERYQYLTQERITAESEIRRLKQYVDHLTLQISAHIEHCKTDDQCKSQVYEKHKIAFHSWRIVEFPYEQYYAFELFQQYLIEHNIDHNVGHVDLEDGTSKLFVLKVTNKD